MFSNGVFAERRTRGNFRAAERIWESIEWIQGIRKMRLVSDSTGRRTMAFGREIRRTPRLKRVRVSKIPENNERASPLDQVARLSKSDTLPVEVRRKTLEEAFERRFIVEVRQLRSPFRGGCHSFGLAPMQHPWKPWKHLARLWTSQPCTGASDVILRSIKRELQLLGKFSVKKNRSH